MRALREDQNLTNPHLLKRARSFLFTPASEPRLVEKAAASDADVVIIDLEDGVPSERKGAARDMLTSHAATLREAGKPMVVRINDTPKDREEDLAAVTIASVQAVMVPKVEGGDGLRSIIDTLSRTSDREVALIALIESPRGLRMLDSILDCPALAGIALGSEDLAACMRAPPTHDLLDLPCRQIAIAAAELEIAGIAVPHSIARFNEAATLSAAAALARAYGLTGGLCIHPAQVNVLNEAFSTSEEQRVWAARVLSAWEHSQAAGSAIAALDGAMIDAPVVALARRIQASR